MCFGTQISAWLRRKMMESMEDRLRRSMGMPTQKEERRERRNREKESRRNDGKFHKPADGGRKSRNPYHHRPDSIIPKEYAEDVEFTEFKEYSSSTSVTETRGSDESSVRFRVEEQVSDVEFIEIKSADKHQSNSRKK